MFKKNVFSCKKIKSIKIDIFSHPLKKNSSQNLQRRLVTGDRLADGRDIAPRAVLQTVQPLHAVQLVAGLAGEPDSLSNTEAAAPFPSILGQTDPTILETTRGLASDL